MGIKEGIASSQAGLKNAYEGTKQEWRDFFHEVKEELTPVDIKPFRHYVDLFKEFVMVWIHVPYFPAFHRPGWLMRYVLGPYNQDWVLSLLAGSSPSRLATPSRSYPIPT